MMIRVPMLVSALNMMTVNMTVMMFSMTMTMAMAMMR